MTVPPVQTLERGPALRARAVSSAALMVAVAHGVNDGYQAVLAPLLPRLMDRLGLSIALAAMLAMTLSISASLFQPVLGYLADRYGGRLFVAFGPAVSGVFLSLIGVAPTFSVLAAFLVLGGLGSAAFHPPGASLAARVGEGRGSGVRMSIFSFGGSVGFAAGPLLAVGVVSAVGLEGFWVAMFPGLVVALVLLRAMPPGDRSRHADPPPSPRAVFRLLAGPLGLLFGISALGAFAQRVFLTLQPIIVAADGRSEALGAATLSVYLGFQALGTLAGGLLADRVDRGPLLAVLTALAFPAHLLAVSLPPGGPGALGAAAGAGFLNMAILPPVVVAAQELIPRGAAASSGIVMGLAWAAGSVGVLGTGILADTMGPRAAAAASMPALLVATLLALHPLLRGRGGRSGQPAPEGPCP